MIRLLFVLVSLGLSLGALADPHRRGGPPSPPPLGDERVATQGTLETALVPLELNRPTFGRVRRSSKGWRALRKRFRMGVGPVAEYMGLNRLNDPFLTLFPNRSWASDFVRYLRGRDSNLVPEWIVFYERLVEKLNQVSEKKSLDDLEVRISEISRRIGEKAREVEFREALSVEEARHFEDLFLDLEVAFLLYQEVGRKSGAADILVKREFAKRPRFWRLMRTALVEVKGVKVDTANTLSEFGKGSRVKGGMRLGVVGLNLGIELYLSTVAPIYSIYVVARLVSTRQQEKEYLASQFLDRIARFGAREALEAEFSEDELPKLDAFLKRIEEHFVWNRNRKENFQRALCEAELK